MVEGKEEGREEEEEHPLNERDVGQRKDSGTGGWEQKGVTSYTLASCWGRGGGGEGVKDER